jgi:hypothetical protein
MVKPAEQSELHESTVTDDSNSKPMSKRDFLRALGSGITGCLALGACKNHSSFGSGTQKADLRSPDNQDAGQTTRADAQDSATIDVGLPLQCDALSQTDTIVLEDSNELDPSYAPIWKLYGSETLASLAFCLAQYTTDDQLQLHSMSIIRADGQILATRVFTAADFDSTGYMRPVLVNDLRLKGQLNLTILLTDQAGTQYRYQPDVENTGIETTFNGIPIVSTSRTIVDAPFASFQAIPDIGNGQTGFKDSDDPQKVFQNRPLRTAQADAQFTTGSGLSGALITDLVGRQIAADGSQFTNIVEYQSFVIYRLHPSGNTYYRTMVRMG